MFKLEKRLILRPPFDRAWQDVDPFIEMDCIDGESYRSVKTRETARFDFEGGSYFIKRHYGTSVKEIVKNLLTLKMPVLGASQEWNAVEHLHKVGVDTMEGVAFGEKGLNPLTRKSFIITKDLAPVIQLDHFFVSEEGKQLSYAKRQAIIERVATMLRTMHRSGLNHRDCYLCHFLLHTPLENIENLRISVIDLHRAQIRQSVPRRWRDKDLIALYYSCLDLKFSNKEVLRFMRIYFDKPLRDIFKSERALLEKVHHKVKKIHTHTVRLGKNK